MDIIPAVAAQVTREQMEQIYISRDISALRGAIESQAMIQAELTAMIQDLMPQLAQNVDIRV